MNLKDFREQEFLEQISALAEIESSKDPASVDGLCELLTEPVGDDAVDTMVRNTLRTLLLAHENAAVERLSSENPKLRDFCVGIVGEKQLASAAPKLIELAESETDPEMLLGVLGAMAAVHAPEFLPVFRKHAGSSDPLIAGTSIKALGEYRDAESIGLLEDIVSANEDDERYARCELSTWSAVDALAEIGSAEALDFLAGKLHHRNPTARRLIHEALTRLGEPAVAPVAAMFKAGDRDEKIMAANVLGFIGHKAATDVLLDALEGKIQDHNITFAVYEALGQIRSMKVLVALLDSLPREKDPAMLLAVVGALDKQVDEALGRNLLPKFKELAKQDSFHWQAILSATIQSGAANLFVVLCSDPELGERAFKLAKRSADTETAAVFRERLEDLGDPRAAELTARVKDSSRPTMLAVDDSGAMRSFYRACADELGLDVSVAENGRVAWDMLEAGEEFDIVVVDMNMPEMDGIELTTRIRGLENMARTPIVMATTESEKSQAQLAKKAGVSAFLVKPFKAEVLANKIRKFLQDDNG